MSEQSTLGDNAPPLSLEFDDNRLLPALYGDFDRNLARVEQLLGVTVASRGNSIIITGACIPHRKPPLGVIFLEDFWQFGWGYLLQMYILAILFAILQKHRQAALGS